MHHYCASRLAGLARVPGMSESLGADAVTDDETASATGAGAASTDVIRVVVAKPGLDGHDRGAKVVARALRDAGMEVIYTGLHQTPEQIVEAAIQEDADVVGLSVLSGAHMTLFARVVELLAERDASDIVVFGGGIIPADDISELEKLGVAKVFTPGATTMEIVGWVREHVHAA
jgi:methylmalonyl-CoA mutase C-terminal domain/subunit